jgi:hypothetical protein
MQDAIKESFYFKSILLEAEIKRLRYTICIK